MDTKLAPTHAIDQAALQALGQLVTQGGGPSWPAAKPLEDGLRAMLLRDPLDSLIVTVLGGSYLFFLAENGKNPKVQSFWDALAFVTTCLSVGYDDVFARTDAGKAIASFLMTLGPALSGAALDPPAAEKAAAETEALEVQRAILARLDAIHAALAAPPAPPSST